MSNLMRLAEALRVNMEWLACGKGVGPRLPAGATSVPTLPTEPNKPNTDRRRMSAQLTRLGFDDSRVARAIAVLFDDHEEIAERKTKVTLGAMSFEVATLAQRVEYAILCLDRDHGNGNLPRAALEREHALPTGILTAIAHGRRKFLDADLAGRVAKALRVEVAWLSNGAGPAPSPPTTNGEGQ